MSHHFLNVIWIGNKLKNKFYILTNSEVPSSNRTGSFDCEVTLPRYINQSLTVLHLETFIFMSLPSMSYITFVGAGVLGVFHTRKVWSSLNLRPFCSIRDQTWFLVPCFKLKGLSSAFLTVSIFIYFIFHIVISEQVRIFG